MLKPDSIYSLSQQSGSPGLVPRGWREPRGNRCAADVGQSGVKVGDLEVLT